MPRPDCGLASEPCTFRPFGEHFLLAHWRDGDVICVRDMDRDEAEARRMAEMLGLRIAA